MEQPECSSYLVDVFNKCGLGLGIASGVSLGLFTHLAAKQTTFVSSQELADLADCKERYVREWLGLMVVGRIVEMDEKREKFRLKDGFENHLAHIEGRVHDYPGVSRVLLFSMGSLVRDKVEDCFKTSGPRGLAYSEYKGFHTLRDAAVQAEGSTKPRLDGILANVPSLGVALQAGISLLEIGCSTGLLAEEIALQYPKSTVVGTDISADGIAVAQNRMASNGLTNLSFETQDAACLPESYRGKFGAVIVVNVIHDVPYPETVLSRIYNSLANNGMFVMVDVYAHSCPADNMDMKSSMLKYFASMSHCVPISMSFDNGKGLGAMWGIEVQKAMLEKAGFVDVIVGQDGEKSVVLGLKKASA